MTIGNNLTTGGMSIGNALTTGSINIASGTGFTTGNIGIGAGSTVRGGVINIGTGGTGGISIGNATCVTNSYNLRLDGSSLRMPTLIMKGSVVYPSLPAGSSSQLIGTPTIISGYTNADLVCIVYNGDINVQPNMMITPGLTYLGALYAIITNATASAARINYFVYC